ncbi:cyclin-like protein [Armillaria luteobubalina]|uniref:Cyclin-like protein n=1 Tax=Armillaria luteobubalina TaxID=153913 RepID=A0AA39QLP2_9AGAR|nr:cyclin-like protein [Armillaria luteobubalina]
MDHSRAQSPSQFPASRSKYYRPYFTADEIQILSEKQKGKLSVTQEDKVRQTACGFLEALGARMGFPRRTVATAQNLYHRFHLFFPRKDFNYHDVCLAALYVSTKMHDTLKKPRELLAVSYALRFPDLVAKSKNPAGEVDLDTMDPAIVEHDRQRLLAIERLMLETICFNFTSRMPFPYVIKIGRALGATKQIIKLAWRLAVDSHRTLVPIQYTPVTVALSSIYLASLLLSWEQPESPREEPDSSNAHDLRDQLRRHGDWESRFQTHVEDLDVIAHEMLDLLIQAAQSPSANTSPRTPSSPSPHPSPRNQHLSSTAQAIEPLPYNADQLLRLKIYLRESEHHPRYRYSFDPNGIDDASEALGKNEGTVRFLFGPPGIVGQGI